MIKQIDSKQKERIGHALWYVVDLVAAVVITALIFLSFLGTFL